MDLGRVPVKSEGEELRFEEHGSEYRLVEPCPFKRKLLRVEEVIFDGGHRSLYWRLMWRLFHRTGGW